MTDPAGNVLRQVVFRAWYARLSLIVGRGEVLGRIAALDEGPEMSRLLGARRIGVHVNRPCDDDVEWETRGFGDGASTLSGGRR